MRRAERKHHNLEVGVFVRRSGGRWSRSGSASDCGRPERVPRAAWEDLAPACKDFIDDGTPEE
jgi:hypothetical protein